MKTTILFTVLLVVVGAMMTSAEELCGCHRDYTPVCGEDGQTYSNECSMDCAAVKMAYRGTCGKATLIQVRP